MWDVPPTLGHSFPAPAHSPSLPPPPLPRPPPLSPRGFAVGAAAFVPSRLVLFRVVVFRGLPACRCPSLPRVLFLFRFGLPRLPSVLLAPSRGHIMKPM